MKIEIVTKHLSNDAAIRTFIERKIHFALDRINARVRQVTVRLEDESSSSDAFGGSCRIDAALSPMGQVHVSARGGTPFDSVLQAARKMEHAIKHDIDRHRRSARVRHQQAKRKVYAGYRYDEFSSDPTNEPWQEIHDPERNAPQPR